MKNDKLLNAIGKINDELVFAAMEVPIKKVRAKRKAWIKGGAIAACLCLFLVIPVAAAAKDILVNILSDRTGWSVTTKERIAVEDFSNEVQEFVKESKEESKFLVMENVAEAEKFLGVALPDNMLLEEASKDDMHVEININGQKERYDAHCIVYLRKNKEEKLALANTEAAYRYGGVYVSVNYRINTEDNRYDSGFGVVFEERQSSEAIEYITSSGRECVIFYEGEEGGIFGGYGYTLVDGVLVQLYLLNRSEESVQNCMLKLLDAFE